MNLIGNQKYCILSKNRYQTVKQASITVEAAFVMPIVIFTIFALIYLAFYLHDYSRIQGALDNALHKAAINMKHEADFATGETSYEDINDRGVFYLIVGSTAEDQSNLITYLQDKLKNSLFLLKITSIDADVGKLSTTISIEASDEIVLPYFQYLFDRYSHVRIVNSAPMHNPAETVRCAEVILDTGSNIKGVEQLKEKLEDFFGAD